MAEENCDAFGLVPGEVRENLTLRGVDLQALPAGTRLEIGGAAREITKDCEPCAVIDGEVRYVRVAASTLKKGLVTKAPKRTWKKDAAAKA